MAKTKEITLYDYSAYQLATSLVTPGYGGGGGIVGRDQPYSGMVYTYVSGRIPAYNLADSLSSAAVIHSVVFSISPGAPDGYTAYAGVLSQSLANTSYEQQYSIISVAPKTWTITTGSKTEINITDPDVIAQVLRCGIGINPGSSGNWKSYVTASMYVTYSDPNEAPEVTGVTAPSTIYTSDDITVHWNYAQSADLAQTAVDVQLCTADGSVAYTLADKMETTEKNITINLRNVQEKLTEGEGWALRVRAYAKSNTLMSAWAQSAAVTLCNLAVSILSPRGGENRLAASVNRMRWGKAEGDVSENAPFGFTVQKSEDAGETWTDLLTKAEANSDSEGWYIDVPADTFRHGAVQWRVLPWSTQYQYGSYVREMFYAVIQASTSSVQCDGKPLPTLSWTSSSQVAYQVRFADYDSGAIFGTEKSHLVPYVYENGLYAAQVRTQAATGEWSAWTETQYVQVTNSSPGGAVTLKASKTDHAVDLAWTGNGNFAAFILYRNNLPIHAGADERYTDVYANGKVTYFVRGITTDGNYLQSDSRTLDAFPRNDCIYDIAGARFIPMKYSAEPRRRQYRVNKVVAFRYYAGRSKPVAYTEGFMERSASFACIAKSLDEARTLETLAGAEVIAKSKGGTSIRGIMNSVSRTEGTLHDITFIVTETDWEEKVPYETP